MSGGAARGDRRHYAFGWRVRDEVLTLERRQVDIAAGTIRLDPGRTKNDGGCVVYLTPALAAALGEQLERVRTLERQTGRVVPYVFPHLRGRLLGQRLKDFKRAWATACIRAGFFRVVRLDAKTEVKVPTKLLRDFRRTAVRNMVNDGTPEKVAMRSQDTRRGRCSTATISWVHRT